MGGGDKKTPKVKPATSSSVFKNVQNSYTNLPGFGNASSIIDPKTKSVTNTFTPDAGVASILDGAKQGIATNQSIFNLTPEQQLAQVDSNPYYQYGKIQTKNYLDQGQAEARQAASASGLENSTIAGAIEASLLRDAAETDLGQRLGAVDYSRAMAGENLATQQGLLDQIFGFTMAPTELANGTLMHAGDNQDQMGMFNAGQIQNANTTNAQMRFQAQQAAAQRRSALIGNLISAGASIAAAPLTGGMSLVGMAGKSLGGFLKR